MPETFTTNDNSRNVPYCACFSNPGGQPNEAPYSINWLVRDWLRRVRESQHGHYAAAAALGCLHYCLGIPVLVMTTVVGTSVFASLQLQVQLRWHILTGLMSIGSAVLASLQTFLRFSEKAEKHRAAGAAYGAIRRELEMILSISVGDPTPQAILDGLRARMDTLAKEAPELSARRWENRAG